MVNKDKKSKWSLLFICVSCIIGAVLPFFSALSIWTVNDVGFGCSTDVTKCIYWVIDALTPDDEEHYFSQAYDMDKMTHYITELEESDSFQYCVYGQQTIFCNDKEIMTYEVNQKTLELFPVQLADGNNLDDSDFSYATATTIPVLVGYNLREQYPVGTKIPAEFMCTNVEFIVKGILSDGVSFPFHDECVNENDNIIVPSMHFALGSENTFLKKALSLQHITGYIIAEKDMEFSSILKEVDRYRNKYDIFDVKFARIDALLICAMRLRNNPFIFTVVQVLIFAYMLAKWNVLYSYFDISTTHRHKVIGSLIVLFAEIAICLSLRAGVLTYNFNWIYVTPYYICEMIAAVLVYSLQTRRAAN